MYEPSEEKRALRVRMKALRAALKNEEADERIARFAFEGFQRYQRFFVYLSFGTEVSTKGLISALLKAGKEVFVPRLIKGELCAVPYTDKPVLDPLGFPAAPEGEDVPCEVCFTPLLAVDPRGNRLGYGGGYYDRYFSRAPDVLRVGLCYAGQVLPSVPAGKGDEPLSFVVTEKGKERIA